MIADVFELAVLLAAVAVCDKARREPAAVDPMDAVYARTVIRDRRTLPRMESLIDGLFGPGDRSYAAHEDAGLN